MPRIPLLAAALVLSACAGGPLWTKQGVTNDTARSDVDECQGLAQDATRRDTDINADILASRGHDWASAGTLGLHQSVLALGPGDRADAIMALCMSSKGYAQRP